MLNSLHYKVYGLHLTANEFIPGLLPCECACTKAVKVQLRLLPKWFNRASGYWTVTYSSDDSDEPGKPTLIVEKSVLQECYLLTYADGCTFVVDDDENTIWCTWLEESTIEDAATYLLGPVLAFVARLRGTTCLHASAFAIREEAIALVGEAGAGKSTMAAALAKQGYPILSDDVVALSEEGETILAEPGYPRLRLWPISVKTLFGSENALDRLTPTWDKRYLDLTQPPYFFSRNPAPLAAIYVLSTRADEPNAPAIESMPPSKALMSLVANTYVNYLIDRSMREREFRSLSHLVNTLPVRRVRPHNDPAYLPKLCDAIVEDFLTNCSGLLQKETSLSNV